MDNPINKKYNFLHPYDIWSFILTQGDILYNNYTQSLDIKASNDIKDIETSKIGVVTDYSLSIRNIESKLFDEDCKKSFCKSLSSDFKIDEEEFRSMPPLKLLSLFMCRKLEQAYQDSTVIVPFYYWDKSPIDVLKYFGTINQSGKSISSYEKIIKTDIKNIKESQTTYWEELIVELVAEAEKHEISALTIISDFNHLSDDTHFYNSSSLVERLTKQNLYRIANDIDFYLLKVNHSKKKNGYLDYSMILKNTFPTNTSIRSYNIEQLKDEILESGKENRNIVYFLQPTTTTSHNLVGVRSIDLNSSRDYSFTNKVLFSCKKDVLLVVDQNDSDGSSFYQLVNNSTNKEKSIDYRKNVFEKLKADNQYELMTFSNNGATKDISSIEIVSPNDEIKQTYIIQYLTPMNNSIWKLWILCLVSIFFGISNFLAVFLSDKIFRDSTVKRLKFGTMFSFCFFIVLSWKIVNLFTMSPIFGIYILLFLVLLYVISWSMLKDDIDEISC